MFYRYHVYDVIAGRDHRGEVFAADWSQAMRQAGAAIGLTLPAIITALRFAGGRLHAQFDCHGARGVELVPVQS